MIAFWRMKWCACIVAHKILNHSVRTLHTLRCVQHSEDNGRWTTYSRQIQTVSYVWIYASKTIRQSRSSDTWCTPYWAEVRRARKTKEIKKEKATNRASLNANKLPHWIPHACAPHAFFSSLGIHILPRFAERFINHIEPKLYREYIVYLPFSTALRSCLTLFKLSIRRDEFGNFYFPSSSDRWQRKGTRISGMHLLQKGWGTFVPNYKILTCEAIHFCCRSLPRAYNRLSQEN